MIRRKTKSNPADHALISKLTVKKSFPDYGTMYEVYLGKRRIGFADIDHGKTEISFVNINEEYRRKGVSSFLYDYIEKDLGRKLKPSADLLDDGEAFWEARSKRSNPRDEEFLKKIRIEKYIDTNYNEIYYQVFIDGRQIVRIIYDIKNKVICSSFVDVKYRRKGLASFIYDYIEKDQKIKLKPSFELLKDGEKFWESRLKKNPSPKPKPRKSK